MARRSRVTCALALENVYHTLGFISRGDSSRTPAAVGAAKGPALRLVRTDLHRHLLLADPGAIAVPTAYEAARGVL